MGLSSAQLSCRLAPLASTQAGQAVAPRPEGDTALALQYHTVTPWCEDTDWEVPDGVAVVEQLDGVDRVSLAAEGREVLDDLVAFIREGVERGGALHIQDG